MGRPAARKTGGTGSSASVAAVLEAVAVGQCGRRQGNWAAPLRIASGFPGLFVVAETQIEAPELACCSISNFLSLESREPVRKSVEWMDTGRYTAHHQFRRVCLEGAARAMRASLPAVPAEVHPAWATGGGFRLLNCYSRGRTPLAGLSRLERANTRHHGATHDGGLPACPRRGPLPHLDSSRSQSWSHSGGSSGFGLACPLQAGFAAAAPVPVAPTAHRAFAPPAAPAGGAAAQSGLPAG